MSPHVSTEKFGVRHVNFVSNQIKRIKKKQDKVRHMYDVSSHVGDESVSDMCRTWVCHPNHYVRAS